MIIVYIYIYIYIKFIYIYTYICTYYMHKYIYEHTLPCPPRLMLSTCRITLCLSACKKSNPSLLFWDIASILQTCHFGWFDNAWLWPVKAILPASSKLWCLSLGKKSCLSLPSFLFPLFLKYYKNIRNLLFCVFWACTSKAIVPTCKKLWRLSSKKIKINSMS